MGSEKEKEKEKQADWSGRVLLRPGQKAVRALFLDGGLGNPALRSASSLLAEVHPDLPVFSFDNDSIVLPSSDHSAAGFSEGDIKSAVEKAALTYREEDQGQKDVDLLNEHFRAVLANHQKVKSEVLLAVTMTFFKLRANNSENNAILTQ